MITGTIEAIHAIRQPGQRYESVRASEIAAGLRCQVCEILIFGDEQQARRAGVPFWSHVNSAVGGLCTGCATDNMMLNEQRRNDDMETYTNGVSQAAAVSDHGGSRRGQNLDHLLTREVVKGWHREWYEAAGKSADWIGRNNGLVVVSESTVRKYFRKYNLTVRRHGAGHAPKPVGAQTPEPLAIAPAALQLTEAEPMRHPSPDSGQTLVDQLASVRQLISDVRAAGADVTVTGELNIQLTVKF